MSKEVKKKSKSRKTSDAVKILDHLLKKENLRYREHLAAAVQDNMVASKIYALRQECGLTQAQLAKLIGTSQSVIARLEDSDYRGHSMAMLTRIAEVMGKRVVISFVAAKNERKGKRAA